MKKYLVGLFIVALLCAQSALAGTLISPPDVRAISQQISCATSSTNAALTSQGNLILITDVGAFPVYLNLGVGSGTAATAAANTVITTGQSVMYYLPNNAGLYLACIAVGGTSIISASVEQ